MADGIAQDAALHGDLITAGEVAVSIDIVVGGELDGDVVENQVGTVTHVDAVLGRTGDAAGTNAEEANDFIGPHAEGNFVTDEGDPAGRGLAGDGQIIGARYSAGQRDGAADIKDDSAIGFADGIAECAGTTVAKAGDMVNGAVAAAGGELAKALSAREGGSLGGSDIRQEAKCQQWYECSYKMWQKGSFQSQKMVGNLSYRL